jgi:predicted esterase
MAPGSLKYRQPLVVPARGAHTATVIMLHGLGDSGEGWAPIGAEFSPDLEHVKFVFPNAPMVCVCVFVAWEACARACVDF